MPVASWRLTTLGKGQDQLRALEPLFGYDNLARLEAVRFAVDQLRLAAGFPTFDDFDRPGCREAFNLRKVLEHALAWDTRPPAPGEYPATVDYDGPMPDWWEAEPARVLKWEGEEARQIRDDVNRQIRLAPRFSELLGTDDMEEAIARVAAWKRTGERGAGDEVRDHP